MEVESHYTPLNAITITNTIYASLHPEIAKLFILTRKSATPYYTYAVTWEDI